MFFFFNDTATTEIYPLSLHDALPISARTRSSSDPQRNRDIHRVRDMSPAASPIRAKRSEEHTSELQSQSNLVCRLLLEKKKKESRYGQMLKVTVTRMRMRVTERYRVT